MLHLFAGECLELASNVYHPEGVGHSNLTVCESTARSHSTDLCRIVTCKGVILAAGAWSGNLLSTATGDDRWQEVFKPRRGHLLELQLPSGMPPLRHGLMEMGYTQVSTCNILQPQRMLCAASALFAVYGANGLHICLKDDSCSACRYC